MATVVKNMLKHHGVDLDVDAISREGMVLLKKIDSDFDAPRFPPRAFPEGSILLWFCTFKCL